MHRSILLVVIALAACAPKASDTPATAADSLATMDSALAGDTISALPADSGAVTTSTASKADTAAMTMHAPVTSKAKADSIIGYDSAFGPKYTIDKDGKLVEIKRPPMKRP